MYISDKIKPNLVRNKWGHAYLLTPGFMVALQNNGNGLVRRDLKIAIQNKAKVLYITPSRQTSSAFLAIRGTFGREWIQRIGCQHFRQPEGRKLYKWAVK